MYQDCKTIVKKTKKAKYPLTTSKQNSHLLVYAGNFMDTDVNFWRSGHPGCPACPAVAVAKAGQGILDKK